MEQTVRQLLHKLANTLPKWPQKRYGIYCGTHDKSEVWHSFCLLFGNRFQDESIIQAYETSFAKATGCNHAISFGAGRMALYAILKALDLKQGDEVILPAYTCVVVPNAMIYLGIKPVYVDIDPRNFNMDPKRLAAALNSKTRAIYVQNTFGVLCDFENISQIASAHNLPIIEDAAHSLGATAKGKISGSLTRVAYFSTDHSKMINTHLGGMATTNDEDLAKKLRLIQKQSPFLSHGLVRKILLSFILETILFSPSLIWVGSFIHKIFRRFRLVFYYRDELCLSLPKSYPYPCRLSSAQAHLGISQLKKLDSQLSHRREIARWLESQLGWYGNPAQIAESSWLRYSFLVKSRRQFEKIFSKKFDLGIWFTSVLHGRDQELEKLNYLMGSCPNAELAATHIVNLPTHPRVPLKVIQKIWRENSAKIDAQVMR